jgi:hypothetical protein
MGFLIPKPKTPAQAVQSKLVNVHVTTAIIGKVLAILLGQRRLSQSLIYYADFVAIPHVQQSPSGGGGKGLGGGGGSTQPQTTYTYQAATQGALCSGPVGGIVAVWDTKGKFQQTSSTEVFTVPVGGGTHQVVNHGLFKVDQGVGYAQAYSQGVNDFGSGGTVTLSGSYQVPLVPGAVAAPGVYAVDTSTGTYSFHAADAGKVVSINYSYNLLQLNNTETAQVPGSPFQILVDDSADFLQDTSVVFYPSGAALSKITIGTPAAGQYKVAAGLYTFAAADTLKQVQISYVTNTQNQQSDAQTALNVTLLNGSKGQSPWSYLTSRHPEAAIGYTEVAIVASSAMDLGSNGEIPNYSFEIAGPYQFGAGIVDCDPADCISAILADPFFGIDFPTSCFGDWTQASNFWVANSFFISPLYESQSTVASMISPILEAGMTATFWSEGKLKLVPYGDTSAAGNGQIYVPNTQPVVDLDDTCFIGDGLVKTTRSPWQDAYNKVQVSWSNRLNGYTAEPTTEQDDAAIQRYGLRAETPQNWDFICTLAAAQFAANLRVKRSVNIRGNSTVKLKSKFSFLEPMDLVTLTVPELGWFKKPVRLTKVVDNPADGVDVTFEDFPWGTAQPTLYAKQTGLGFKPNAGQADPGNTAALIFEATNRLGMQKGNVLYIFVSGQTPDWGGCYILSSFDGVKYDDVNGGQPITSPARIGTLVGSLAAGVADPDTSSFQVKMSSAGAVLPNMSSADFAQLVSMCVLIDISDNNPFELLAYKNATLVDKDTFQLDTLHRGLFGTSNAAHSAGESFARLDQASFQFQYDPSYYGQTIFFKFPSFNTVGGRPQPISQASVYSFALPGNSPGALDINTGIYRPGLGSIPPSWAGTITWSSAVPGTSLVVSWNVNVNRGTMPNPSQAGSTLAVTNYNSSQTFTGLTASTPYWLYPYIDDTVAGSPWKFTLNSDVAGAVGSPAGCYTALTPNATYFSGRNDHLPPNNGPLAVSTAPATGSGTGGSGTGEGGACPRGDMVVLRARQLFGLKLPKWLGKVVRIDQIKIGDWVRDRGQWVEVLNLIHGWSNDWTEVCTSCGEEIVVTGGHTWPTDEGDKHTPELPVGTMLQFEDEGNTEITAKHFLVTPGLPVGLIVSGDNCYLIGSKRPRVRTHNGGGVLPRS